MKTHLSSQSLNFFDFLNFETFKNFPSISTTAPKTSDKNFYNKLLAPFIQICFSAVLYTIKHITLYFI